MSSIEQLGERVADAERRFGLIHEQQTKYSERLLGLMNAIEVRQRDQQAEIERQAAEIARLGAEAQRHADESARLAAEIERRIVDAARQAKENEQLRAMLHSLLRAIEGGSRDALAETMQTLDRKVTALIGASGAYELDEAVGEAPMDAPDPGARPVSEDLEAVTDDAPAEAEEVAEAMDMEVAPAEAEEVAEAMEMDDAPAETEEIAEGMDMEVAPVEAKDIASAIEMEAAPAEAEVIAQALEMDDAPAKAGGIGDAMGGEDAPAEVEGIPDAMGMEDPPAEAEGIPHAMGMEDAPAETGEAAEALELDGFPADVADVADPGPEPMAEPAAATLSEIMERVTRLVEQTGGEAAPYDRAPPAPAGPAGADRPHSAAG